MMDGCRNSTTGNTPPNRSPTHTHAAGPYGMLYGYKLRLIYIFHTLTLGNPLLPRAVVHSSRDASRVPKPPRSSGSRQPYSLICTLHLVFLLVGVRVSPPLGPRCLLLPAPALSVPMSLLMYVCLAFSLLMSPIGIYTPPTW